MKKIVLCILFVFLLSGIILAGELKIDGFLDNEFSLNYHKDSGQKEFGDVLRLRLNLTTRLSDRAVLKTTIEYQGYMGDQFGLNLKKRQMRNTNLLLDRFYLDLYLKRGDLRLGRQVVDWGAGRFWNPTDVFNIYDLLLTKEERRGIDVIQAKIPFGTGSPSSVMLVYSAGNIFYANPRSAVKFKTTTGKFDFSTCYAALGQGDYMAGFDFSGEVFKSILYGESGYFVSETKNKKWLSYVIGTNIAFPKDITLSVEYYYNGYGQRNPALYQWEELQKGELFNLARNYLGFSIDKRITPLFNTAVTLSFNLDDNSAFLQPKLTYNTSENTTVQFGINYFKGGKWSEFGRWNNHLFLKVRNNF